MKKTSSAYVLFFMVILCIAFGAAVSTVHYSTRNLLRKNETLHRNRVICNAFMLDTGDKSAAAYQQAIGQYIVDDEITVDNRTIEVFKSETHNAVGFVFSGTGFWDVIRGIVVLSEDFSTILNIQILDQKETPGLGARIEEQWFTDQFKGLKIGWDNPVDERIIIGELLDKNIENGVDAITGATQTSMALMKILNEELEFFWVNRSKVHKVL